MTPAVEIFSVSWFVALLTPRVRTSVGVTPIVGVELGISAGVGVGFGVEVGLGVEVGNGKGVFVGRISWQVQLGL